MAKKVEGYIKLQIPAGKATPAPPVGPALGQHGVNIVEFTKQFNARTADKGDVIIPVVITVYADRSFSFITKTPPAAVLLKKACNLKSGSAAPNKTKVATISKAKLQEIAEMKMPDLNAASLEAAMSMIAGTARSIYLNKYINSFLNTDFESPLDYYNNYLKLLTDSLYLNSLRDGKFAITIHARNDSILNGGCFRKLDDQKGWYQTFEASGQNTLLLANYDDSHTVSNSNLRQVSLIRCMNYYLRDTIEKVVKVDISYSRIEKDLQAANYEADLYVCLNGQLVFPMSIPPTCGLPLKIFLRRWSGKAGMLNP